MSNVTIAEVVNVTDFGNNVREYTIVLSQERKYNPGDFLQLTLESVSASEIWPESRTFSISSYEKGIMRLVIKRAGEYTARIFNELKQGSNCTIKYPFGCLYDKNNEYSKKLFIAGGVGIAPFIGMLDYYKQKGCLEEITLFYSVQRYSDLLYKDYLESILGERLVVFITRESHLSYLNRHINLQDILDVADKETCIYLCGSNNFTNHFKSILLENGYEKLYMDEWE